MSPEGDLPCGGGGGEMLFFYSLFSIFVGFHIRCRDFTSYKSVFPLRLSCGGAVLHKVKTLLQMGAAVVDHRRQEPVPMIHSIYYISF